MANKVKDIKKKGRRLKRSIRKTLGTLFLVSALVVAAIPVDYLQATETGDGIVADAVERDPKEKVTVHLNSDPGVATDDRSRIPDFEIGYDNIYESANGTFQFAYIDPSHYQGKRVQKGDSLGGNRVAIILGYQGGYLENDGTLTIPNTLRAYKIYRVNNAQNVAVNGDGDFLFYRVPASSVTPDVTEAPAATTNPDATDAPDVTDNPATPTPSPQYIYVPCADTAAAIWDVTGVTLYYQAGDQYIEITGETAENKKPINAEVAYIGNQYLEAKSNASTNSRWEVAGDVRDSIEENEPDSSKGIFHQWGGSIVTLNVGNNILGIGDYAFHGCTSMTGITLENGLAAIGNHAFDSCTNLMTVSIPMNSNLSIIGDHAFYNCRSLESFQLPTNVRKIGDFAFDGCVNMTAINLLGESAKGTAMVLSTIGYDAFKDCRSLPQIVFPENYNETLDVATFRGCSGLRYIESYSGSFSLDGYDNANSTLDKKSLASDYGFSYFYNGQNLTANSGMRSDFYLKGIENSKLHEIADAQGIPFNYDEKDQDGNILNNVYELTVYETKKDQDGNEIIDKNNPIATYRVDSREGENGYLVGCDIAKGDTVKIPDVVGPRNVIGIAATAFQDNCLLKSVTIPSTIKTIDAEAFKGCHNLKNVAFSNPSGLTIGEGAFKTQQRTRAAHDSSCSRGSLEITPSLNFIAPITYGENEPFYYAMSPTEYINSEAPADNQQTTYITYYSGLPQNLVVRYDPATDKNTLYDYPTFADLLDIDSVLSDDEAVLYSCLAANYGVEDVASLRKLLYRAAVKRLEKWSSSDAHYDKNDPADDPDLPLSGAEPAIVESVSTNFLIPFGIEAVDTADGGLFAKKEAEEKTTLQNLDISDAQAAKTLTIEGLEEINDAAFKETFYLTRVFIGDNTRVIGNNAFEKCENLTTVSVGGNVQSIGDHAFSECTKLTNVIISSSVSELGLSPFIDCDSLSTVNFSGSNYFTCENSIIFEKDSSGNKVAIVECLNNWSTAMRPAYFTGVSEMRQEAFKNVNAKSISSLDLSQTTIDTIPVSAFENADVQSIFLPETCVQIDSYAFKDSTLNFIHMPKSINLIASSSEDAFLGVNRDSGIEFEGVSHTDMENPTDSNRTIAYRYYESYRNTHNITWSEYEPDAQPYTVEFYEPAEDGRPSFIKRVTVEPGKYVDPDEEPVPAERPGYVFTGWKPLNASDTYEYGRIEGDWSFLAQFEEASYKIVFYNGTEYLGELSVVPGNRINYADTPYRLEDGSIITAWRGAEGTWSRDDDYATFPESAFTAGSYMLMAAEFGGNTVTPSPGPDDPNNPGNQSPGPSPGDQTPTPGPGGSTPTPGPGGSTPTPGGSTPTPTPNPGGTVPRPDGTYSLEVFNGSGSGHYVPGSQIVITADPAPEGQRFAGWDVSPASTVVTDKTRVVTIVTMPNSDVAILAKYESKSGGDDDDSKLYNLEVSGGSGSGSYPAGAQVIITANAAPENQEFSGWDVSPAETVVTDKTRTSTIITMPESDVAAIAKYNSPPEVTPSPAPTQEPTPTPAALHSLIVHNGSGSGSYVAGAQIVIVANDPAAGQEFTGWTVSPDNTVISDKTLSGAVITMPDNDVAVIANFKTKATGSGNSTGSGNNANTNNSGNSTNNNSNNSGSNSGTSTNRPSSGTSTNTATSNRGGTTVVIDKNGLSNTGVVSATVNGSSDNFTIKITESSEATAAVLNALLAEYGSVDNIKYFPMDISLYDSTGNTKITDTTGLSVSITLPLPDSLITYAGNNKVAGVVNDRLDKLTPRFTTINGVSCITFTAEHFSPYVIYVDVANLSNGTVTDATPTTGDGIHPKWFLSIGLACLSFVMFMMKDGGRAPRKKQKVKVRA